MSRNSLVSALLLIGLAVSTKAQSSGQTLYNGITIPAQWPPSQTPYQDYRVPSYITNPPVVIPIDTGRQLFVDDFLIQSTTMTRSQHQPVMYPLNPIIKPNQNDTSGFAMPFSGGVWFDPADQLFKAFLFCGGSPAKVCYSYSTDGKSWIRPSIPDALIPNTDQVLSSGLDVWMDLFDPMPGRKFKAFGIDPNNPSLPGKVLLYFSGDGIHWTPTNPSQYPIAIQYDRSTLFYNPFRGVWVNSMKNYDTLPSTSTRAAYLSRLRNYSESPDLTHWTPAEPENFSTSFWTGPDVNDPPYINGGTPPQLYNLDAVAYESLLVGLFSWFYPGFDDDDPTNLPGPDIVELGVGFSRDGFQWVRPTRGSGTGPNGAFIPASNTPGTWNMGNTQSAGGGFLVVGDELWFYFSGRTARHGDPSAIGATGLATLRRDGFYSMDAGPTPATLTTRPIRFSGKYLFVNVKNPQGTLQVQVLNPADSSVLATSLPIAADKTLQPVTWNGLADLSAFSNQPVQLRFTLTNGELYSFWISANNSGASNGYVAAGGPGFTGPIDTLGAGAYPSVAAAPLIYPAGGLVSTATDITISSASLGATIHYTLDGTNPTATSPSYTGPIHLSTSATVKAIASAPGLMGSPVVSQSFTVDNSIPQISITSPANGQTVSAGITVSANATANAGISSVEFLVDGVAIGTVAAPPYTVNLQTTTLTNSTHQLTAVATNTIGTQATSAPVAITVANAPNGPTIGLVGYWSFDSNYASGSTFFDQSGNNNALSTFSTIGIPGQSGQALNFNGSNSYAMVTSSLNTQQLYDLLGDLSLSLSIQTTNSTRTEAVISKYASGGSGAGYLLRLIPSGTLQLVIGIANLAGGSTVANDTTKINDGSWHRIAVVIKLGSSVSFYIDGALSSTSTIYSTAGTASTFLELGVDPYPPNGANFTGNMDEVRIYNRALTPSDILALSGGPWNPPASTGTAAFVATDTSTQGTWKGAFGRDGYIIANDSNNPPSYGTVSISGANTYTWNGSTLDSRALQSGLASSRIASAYYSNTGFTIDITFSGTATHQVAVYFLDWDNAQRAQIVSVLDAGTQAVLDRRSVSGFNDGIYLVWNISGHVLINVTKITGINTVLSGIFFTPLPGADLTIRKRHSGNFAPGDIGDTYSLTVTNSGSGPTSGPVTVTDSLPSGLTATGIQGFGWNCTQPSGPCSRSDVLPAGSTYPVITLTVNVASNAFATITNTAAVSGGGDVELGNNTTTDLTVITAAPTKTFVTAYGLSNPAPRANFAGWVGLKLTVGSNPLLVTSIGRICLEGNAGIHTIKFVAASAATDVPGASASVNMMGCISGQFVYTQLGTPVTLQPNTTYYLASQETAGGDTWYDYGAVTANADANVNSAIYSADGSSWIAIGGSNLSYVPPNFLYTVSIPPPDLTIAVTHSVAFSQGDTADTYLITVSNTGGNATTGAVTVSATVPAGLTASSIGGTGWTCTQPVGPCSRTDSLSNGSSYPSITLTINVAANAPASVTTIATVSGGGETNINNDSANDVTTIAQRVFVTIATSPAGLSFTIDGVTYASTQTVTWLAGSTHVIAARDPQSAGAGMQYAWAGWSDGGEISHSVSPSASATFTASFILQYQLTTATMPSGGGAVTVTPSSANGYYPAGTSVQLTAFPGADYIFVNWTGDLNESTNSQTIVLSSPRSVTANFQLLTAAISGYALNNPPARNNFTGWVGTKFTINANPLAVSSVGRICLAGNFGTHIVKFVRASTGADVPGASATVNMSGCTPGQFVYTFLPSPVTLLPNVTYYLVTQELLGADQWYDYGSIKSSADITVNGSIYFIGSTWVQVDNASTSYVPPNFKYFVASASTSFITDYNLNSRPLRNDFSGWVGMQFTVGSAPVTVSALGRICTVGNSATHNVELISPGTGASLPGAVVLVNMAGCSAGDFVYTTLNNPIILPANSSYYLVTQELAGGDRWYDFGTVVTTSVATVNRAVYSYDGVNWITLAGANTSYVPPNFK